MAKGKGNISVRVWHPSQELEFLSDLLLLECFRSWVAGAPRTTPKGKPLSGINAESYWVGDAEFPDAWGWKEKLLFLLDVLTNEGKELSKLTASGGRIEFYMHLPGRVNHGDTLEPPLLQRMGEMGIELTIEVFPHMQVEDEDE